MNKTVALHISDALFMSNYHFVVIFGAQHFRHLWVVQVTLWCIGCQLGYIVSTSSPYFHPFPVLNYHKFLSLSHSRHILYLHSFRTALNICLISTESSLNILKTGSTDWLKAHTSLTIGHRYHFLFYIIYLIISSSSTQF